MKLLASNAAWVAYLGILCVIVGLYPGTPVLVGQSPIYHTLWHLWLFVGAGLTVYGLETLRTMARRHQKMML